MQKICGFCDAQGCSQVVVVDDSSAAVPSLEASTVVPLPFSSSSGVLGGAAFMIELLILSAWSGLGLESGPGSGVPLVMGSGVVDSGVGVRAILISKVGVLAFGPAG